LPITYKRSEKYFESLKVVKMEEFVKSRDFLLNELGKIAMN